MSVRHFTILAIALLAMSGCAEDKAAGDKAAADVKAASAQPAAKSAAKGKTPAKGQVEEDALPVLSVPEGFRYDARGRRDPFVNPIPKPVVVATQAADVPPPVRPDGLPGVLVQEAKITAIITSKEPGMTRAVINAPGKKTYFAVKGDTLFDGVIKDIRQDGVVFTMISPTTKRPIDREIIVKTGTSGEKK